MLFFYGESYYQILKFTYSLFMFCKESKILVNGNKFIKILVANECHLHQEMSLIFFCFVRLFLNVSVLETTGIIVLLYAICNADFMCQI